MHDFKKGDLVRHVPSGCVAMYVRDRDGDDMGVLYARLECHPFATYQEWFINDCEPYRDPTPVIEAAKFLIGAFEGGFRPSYPKNTLWCRLKNALAEYEGETLELESVPPISKMDEPEPDYTWLALSESEIYPVIYRNRPDYEDGDFLCSCDRSAIEEHPSWLKPGQLWERVPWTEADVYGLKEFQGHWWRLIEDHSEDALKMVQSTVEEFERCLERVEKYFEESLDAPLEVKRLKTENTLLRDERDLLRLAFEQLQQVRSSKVRKIVACMLRKAETNFLAKPT